MPLRALLVGLGVIALAVGSSSASAQATPPPAGTLVEVRVEGTTTFADIVRTIVAARPGTPIERIDLEAERNRVYALGSFEEVTVTLEDRGGGPILLVRVRENPRIADVEIRGVERLDPAAIREVIVDEHRLQPGLTLNTTRVDAAVRTIQRIYRSPGVGTPFDVTVVLDLIPDRAAPVGPDGRAPVRLVYLVEETAPLREVQFEPSTVLSEEELRQIFSVVIAGDVFDLTSYAPAVEEVARRYAAEGYRQSGVDLEHTELENGQLTVRFRELRIVSVNTAALGIDPDELSLRPGDLFNYDVLLEDVRRLAAGRTADVRIDAVPTAAGGVRVTFLLGAPDTAGPITEIAIEGNTVFSDERIEEVLFLREGDTFTSTLAQEDFVRIRTLYTQAGYVIADRPSFNWLDGTYVQRVAEQRIAGYEISYEGRVDHTQPWVITRYLPDEGEVLNLRRLDEGLRDVARLGVVTPVSRHLLPTDVPDEVVVNVVVRANQTGVFQPSAQYNTETGFSAAMSFSETNLWGRAHSVTAEVDAQTSDLGIMLGGSVRYAIPWLYADWLDFQEVPTSFTVSAFSIVTTDQRLTLDGELTAYYPGLEQVEENRVLVGEYTLRTTGLSLSVGRPVLPFTNLVVSARGSYNEYKLEPSVACEIEDGLIVDDRCTLPEELALEALPQSGLSAFVGATLAYDDRDSANFPTRGFTATGSAGFGWGNDIRDPVTDERRSYTYQQVQAGGSTYLRLSDAFPGSAINPNHVFAVRLHGGHQFGAFYPTARRFTVGRVQETPTMIRGFRETDFNPSRTYLTSSLEYRYDFGLTTFATETVIGIVFVDAGYASNVPGFPEYGTPIFASAGVGVQVNLGFAGVAFPAIRFDYGFSERNPTGVFSFRIGPVF